MSWASVRLAPNALPEAPSEAEPAVLTRDTLVGGQRQGEIRIGFSVPAELACLSTQHCGLTAIRLLSLQVMKQISKIRNISANLRAPPSKAHTLRSLLMSSLADGVSVVHDPLLGEDQRNLMDCLKRLGVRILQEGNSLKITGMNGCYSPIEETLDVGESGVSMNFLCAACCLSVKPVVISGAPRILERPIEDVVQGLRQLGCQIDYLGEEGYPPIKVHGGGIPGGTARMDGHRTSQYFSGIAIAAPYAKASVTLVCTDSMSERPYFDITVELMRGFGASVKNSEYTEIAIPARQHYSAQELCVEGDYSSAAFFFLAAAICRSRIAVQGLNLDTRQGDKKFLELLEAMGCSVSKGPESIGVEGNDLRAIQVNMADVPDLVPPIAIAAAHADGMSRFSGIGHLRHKECDRLAVMASELQKLGVEADVTEDALIVKGCRHLKGATIDPHNDHRIAMSFAIEGLVRGDVVVKDKDCVAKSFPDFWERFKVFAQK